ncbi:hypothetical protein CL622_04195 [archaeon]|nr:hypothetical protein [archaeon]
MDDADFQQKMEMYLQGDENPFGHVDADGNTPLMVAIKNGNVGQAQQILKLGAEACKLDHVDKNGNTALMVIFTLSEEKYDNDMHGDMETDVGCVIVKFGAKACKLDHVNNGGDTALILAVRKRADWVIKVMVKVGPEECNLNHVNKDGETALIVATRNDSITNVYLFISMPDCHVSYIDDQGHTAMYYIQLRHDTYMLRNLYNGGFFRLYKAELEDRIRREQEHNDMQFPSLKGHMN